MIGPSHHSAGQYALLRQAVTVRTLAFVMAATTVAAVAPPPSAGPSPLRTARPTDGSPWATSSPTSPRHRPPVPRGPRRHRGGVRSVDVPALLLWGPRDPVFADRYLAELRERLPQAQLHRYEGASHLLPEDAPQYAEAVAQWWQTSIEVPVRQPTPNNQWTSRQPRPRRRRAVGCGRPSPSGRVTSRRRSSRSVGDDELGPVGAARRRTRRGTGDRRCSPRTPGRPARAALGRSHRRCLRGVARRCCHRRC